MEPVNRPLGVLLGPTASGKSSLAIAVALRLNQAGHPAEIVNADSMAIYRGMDIGTAKPNSDQLRTVRHHLIDILEPAQPASVAQFQQLARDTIAEIRGRGVIPLLVGGSALYTRAIVDEFEFPGTDPQVRARWQARIEAEGSAALHAELTRINPEAAAEILPGNQRRIVRALEVMELTGQFRATLPAWQYALPEVHQFGLTVDREQMDAQIAERVHQMWRQGLIEEVAVLADQGLAAAPTASRALGYSQALDQLAGRISQAEAIEQTITGTRRFARKQLGWFRRDPRIAWLPAGDPANVETICERLLHPDSDPAPSADPA